MELGEDSAQVLLPWPRYPTETPNGNPSRAKTAGKYVPWLRANLTNNLPQPVWAQLRGIWREAAAGVGRCHWRAVDEQPLTGRIVVVAMLHKRTAVPMDPWAVLEGMKPVIDGLVEAGLLADDECVAGGIGGWCKAAKGDCRLELTLHRLDDGAT